MTHWTLHCCIFAIFRVVWCTSSTNFVSQDPYKFFIYKNSLDYSTSWYNKAPNFSYPSSNTEFWFVFHGSMVSSVLIHFIVKEEIWSKPEFFCSVSMFGFILQLGVSNWFSNKRPQSLWHNPKTSWNNGMMTMSKFDTYQSK